MQPPAEAPFQATAFNAELIDAGTVGVADVDPHAITDGIIGLAVSHKNLRYIAKAVYLTTNHGSVPLQPGTVLNVWGATENGTALQTYIDDDRQLRMLLRHEDGSAYLPPTVMKRLGNIAAVSDSLANEATGAVHERNVVPDEQRDLAGEFTIASSSTNTPYTDEDQQALLFMLEAEEVTRQAAAEREIEVRIAERRNRPEVATHRLREPLRTRIAAGATALARNIFGSKQTAGRRRVRPDGPRPVTPMPQTRPGGKHRKDTRESALV